MTWEEMGKGSNLTKKEREMNEQKESGQSNS